MKPDLITVAEVDLNALSFNYRGARRLAGRQGVLMAVVKADAYGHGMIRCARHFERLGVEFLGVSDISEGILLRDNGVKRPILIFENTLKDQAGLLLKYRLTPTICTMSLARDLNRYAQKKKKKIAVHIKVDTGMGRLGVWYKEAPAFIRKIKEMKHLKIEGVYTHFPVADTDPKFTQTQIAQMRALIAELNRQNIRIPYIHSSNSMGMAGYKCDIFNLARPGLMLYGLYPGPQLKRKIKLKPALSVKSRIIFVKKLEKGQGVSYGRTFIARRNMTAATIPIGYNDGYFRAFSNKTSVLIGGVRCPVLGRVTMDQMVVDVSKVKTAKTGTEVVILGRQKNQNVSAEELAAVAGTINYEIICALGGRLPKTYK